MKRSQFATGRIFAALVVYTSEGSIGYPCLEPETLAGTREGSRRLAARWQSRYPRCRFVRVIPVRIEAASIPGLRFPESQKNYTRLERWQQAASARRQQERAA